MGLVIIKEYQLVFASHYFFCLIYLLFIYLLHY